jgi:hypothetical protein
MQQSLCRLLTLRRRLVYMVYKQQPHQQTGCQRRDGGWLPHLSTRIYTRQPDTGYYTSFLSVIAMQTKWALKMSTRIPTSMVPVLSWSQYFFHALMYAPGECATYTVSSGRTRYMKHVLRKSQAILPLASRHNCQKAAAIHPTIGAHLAGHNTCILKIYTCTSKSVPLHHLY